MLIELLACSRLQGWLLFVRHWYWFPSIPRLKKISWSNEKPCKEYEYPSWPTQPTQESSKIWCTWRRYRRISWNDGSGVFSSQVTRKLDTYASIRLRWILHWICGPSQVRRRHLSEGQSNWITGQTRWFREKIRPRTSYRDIQRARSGLCAQIHYLSCLIHGISLHGKWRCKSSRCVVCHSWLAFMQWEFHIGKCEDRRQAEGVVWFGECLPGGKIDLHKPCLEGIRDDIL